MKAANPRPQRTSATRRMAGRAQQDGVIDPYQRRQKLHKGTRCPNCGAVFDGGRWQWSAAGIPAAGDALCPACRRIDEKLPAGIVELSGAFAGSHKDEILRLARHQEEVERGEHPLNRIMGVAEEPRKITISTTDIHLPRRIGEAVERAFGGKLASDFDEDNYFVRVRWAREG